MKLNQKKSTAVLFAICTSSLWMTACEEPDINNDSGVQDSGVQDSGVQDSGVQDSSFQDSSIQDSSTQDSSIQDSTISDAGVGDSATDAGAMDAASNGRPSTNEMCDRAEAKYMQCGHPFGASCPLAEIEFAENESTRDTDACQYSNITATYYQCIENARCEDFQVQPNGRYLPPQCITLRDAVNAELERQPCQARYDVSSFRFPETLVSGETQRVLSGPALCEYEDSNYYIPDGNSDNFMVTRFDTPAGFQPTRVRLRAIWNALYDGCGINDHPIEFWLIARPSNSPVSTLAADWNPARTEQHYVMRHNQLRSYEDDMPVSGITVPANHSLDLVVRLSYADRDDRKTCLLVCNNHSDRSARGGVFEWNNGAASYEARTANVVTLPDDGMRNTYSVASMANAHDLYAVVYGR